MTTGQHNTKLESQSVFIPLPYCELFPLLRGLNSAEMA